MVNKIPQLYRKSSDNIVNVGVYDAIEGTTNQIFYPFSEKTSGSTTYKLGTEIIYSSDILLSGSWSSVPDTVFDQDFDLQFNLSKIIKGKIDFNIPVKLFGGGSPGFHVFSTIQKVSGANVTDLGTVGSEIFNASHQSGIINYSFVAEKTKFEAGDILRYNLNLRASGGTGNVNIGIDPKNRSEGSEMQVGTNIDTTTTIIKIPFILDI